MKKILSLVLASALVFSLGGCAVTNNTSGSQTAGGKKKYTIATVVKLTNSAWFERMNKGVDQFAKDTGADAYQIGPQKADAALQIQMIEDLIAKKVDAIVVVPVSPEALQPVLKKARQKGIVVVSEEAANSANVDYDVEAFDNQAYGQHLMDKLGQLMNGQGDYATMLGTITTKSHAEWVAGEESEQKQKYPNMKLVADKIESQDDEQTAYQKVKELLQKDSNLKGIQGNAMPDVAGAALAVEEMGLQGKVQLVGTSLVSVSGKYLKDGTINMISFWDPALAGYAGNKVALDILEGKKSELKDGVNLGAKGYENVKLKGNTFYGQAWIDVTKDNMDQYNF